MKARTWHATGIAKHAAQEQAIAYDLYKMDKAEFNAAVYHIVRLIPPQRITSYSHVAKLIGMPKHARHVRESLKLIIHTAQPAPWHRVTSTAGILSSRNPTRGLNNTRSQRDLLELEGVEVEEGTVGELRIDFTRWGWFPEVGSFELERAEAREAEASVRIELDMGEEERDWGG